MIRKLALFISLFILVSGGVEAGTTIGDKTIKAINLGWSGEAFYVYVNESFDIAEGCSIKRFKMPHDAPLFKENLSMALSAFLTNAKVSFYVTGCSSGSMHLKAINITK